MPRDGLSIYTQPFPDVAPGTTIESTVYNGFTHDVEQDLNAPRPIIAGGTGASSATDALFNLKAEMATQVVTNYDSHVWVPGSFRSAAGATGAPTANAFAGVCYIGEALANPPTNQNVVVEARDLGDASVPGLVYVREKTAGVWSAWVVNPDAASIAATIAALEAKVVKHDADQGLTETQQVQARENIAAAPLDVLAYSGMQVNGSMSVSQERGTSGTAVDATYICDGWILGQTVVGAISGFQSLVTNLLGFAHYINVTVNTAQPSLAAGDFFYVYSKIEGYRIARLGWGSGLTGAQPITIGFWTCHHRPGTYSGTVFNAAANRSYVFSYTQSVADAWEYKTATVPADATGVWNNANTVGLIVGFAIAVGTTYTSPAANVWSPQLYLAVPGQVNGVTTTADVFRITGVVVLPGIYAPTAAQSPLIMRPFDQELLTCQRYWQRINGAAYLTNVGVSRYFGGSVQFFTPTRTVPTVTALAGYTATNLLTAPYADAVTYYGLRAMAQCNVAGDASFSADFSCDARL